MKRFLALVFLSGSVVRAQVQVGTVLYLNFSADEATLAADSRSNYPETGEHDDMECKISAFGPDFVFTMAGAAQVRGGWNAHSIARTVWATESKSKADASRLVPAVAKRWAEEMEQIYGKPEFIERVSKAVGDQGVLANAFFAGTDRSGHLTVEGLDIDFDRSLLKSSGKVRVFLHSPQVLSPNSWLSAGDDEVVGEFRLEQSAKAKEYMNWFLPQLAGFSRSVQQADLASKLIELSILLHPKRSELGFPIDVVQLERSGGVHWLSLKGGCPRD